MVGLVFKTKEKLLVVLLLCFSVGGYTQVILPDIISSHMVLKQKSVVPLWGKDKPGQELSVLTGWDRKKYNAVADGSGLWKVMVSTPSAGGPYNITFAGTDTIKLTDVLIGEVWISSGQSNMAFRLRQDSQAKVKLPQANNPQIRLYRPARVIAQEEMDGFSANRSKWEVSSAKTATEFSAMTYYFAAELQKKLQVPVGVINVSWGGVSIESWLPESALTTNSILQNSVVRWKKWANDYEVDSPKYVKENSDYARTKEGNKPELPQSMYMMRRPHRQYSVLYNGMTAPLTPFALSGLLWYQGTSSVAWSEEYELQLNTLIHSWRKAFDDTNMPVIVGQLTAYKYDDEAKAYQLRDAQLAQRGLKNVYVVCNMDLGELDNLHPTNKEPYGLRFAGMALNQVYSRKDLAAFCPSFKSIRAEGDRLIVSFDHAEGLHIKGGAMEEVYIAGADQKFVKAMATIHRNELVVSNPSIKHPKHVRYLYKNTVRVQLYNGDDLPAFPFTVKFE
jgi:sialate O-acetylesterase